MRGGGRWGRETVGVRDMGNKKGDREKGERERKGEGGDSGGERDRRQYKGDRERGKREGERGGTGGREGEFVSN